MNSPDSLVEVAQIGRLVGIKGELKLHLHCDFPEQFKKGATFTTHKGEVLEVFSYHPARALIAFVGYLDRLRAGTLVNTILYTTKEASLSQCALKEGEFFWFDLMDATLIDNDGSVLGVIEEIERIGAVDYVVVQSDEALVKQGLAKRFYLPYIDRYILRFDKEGGVLYVQDGMGIVENS